jgi:gliding motility-associated-like protein
VHSYTASAKNGSCESLSSLPVSVTVNPSGEVSIAQVAPVCQGEDVVLTATASNVAASPTYKWYYAGFEVASGSSNEVSIPNVGTTSDWVVSVTNNTACGGEVSSQPIIVEILTKPVPKLKEFGEVLVCAPKEVELTVDQGQQPQVGAGLEISWYEGTDPTPIATGDSYTVRSNGVYSVVMSNQGCVSEASPLSVVDVKIQDLQVSIDQDNMDVEENTEVYLTTTVEDEIGNISYDWRSDETGGTIGTTSAIDYLAVSRDTIQVLIKDESSGCEATSQKVWINVLEPVNIPTAFTPNGDGINDTWNIEGLETYRNASVRIYNRWGALVYSKTGSYFNDWDGTNNGKELPNGTYYYVIQLNQPGKGDLTGDVSVIR